MKYYLDTNIWVSAFNPKHSKNKASKQLLKNCSKQNIEIVTSGHCLAEVYSVLTKLPKGLRLSPHMTFNLIEYDMINKCQIIDLTYQEYAETIKDAANKNLISGAIFDGLHVKAALKAGVDRIYTYNLKDFERFDIPESVVLCTPSD